MIQLLLWKDPSIRRILINLPAVGQKWASEVRDHPIVVFGGKQLSSFLSTFLGFVDSNGVDFDGCVQRQTTCVR